MWLGMKAHDNGEKESKINATSPFHSIKLIFKNMVNVFVGIDNENILF